MTTSPPAAVVARFMEAINSHDLASIMALLTPDHQFLDPAGALITGDENLRRSWASYFIWFPNYEVRAERFFTDGDTVALFGHAGGTYSGGRGTVGENTWRLPAAWFAKVRGERIAVWQVYCDTEPVLAIMRSKNSMRAKSGE